jgi:hypothetical protein
MRTHCSYPLFAFHGFQNDSTKKLLKIHFQPPKKQNAMTITDCEHHARQKVLVEENANSRRKLNR